MSGYTALNRLLLDNNKIGLAGALLLSEVLPSLQLSELNIGFNEIEADGLKAIVRNLVHNSYLHSLALSGNAIDGEVSRLIAFMLVHNSALEKLYLDRTNMDSRSEKNIAAGLASSKASALRTLTGFSLGPVLSSLGSPSVLESLSNDRVLRYLSQMWASQKEAERLELESALSNIVREPSNTVSGNVRTVFSADEGVLIDGMDAAIGDTTDSLTVNNSNNTNSSNSSKESVDISLAEGLQFIADSCYSATDRGRERERERGSISTFSSQVSEADISDSLPPSPVPTSSAPSSSSVDVISSAATDIMVLEDGITNSTLISSTADVSEHFDGYQEGDMRKRFSFAGVHVLLWMRFNALRNVMQCSTPCSLPPLMIECSVSTDVNTKYHTVNYIHPL